MSSEPEPHDAGKHLLGPHVVGQRVVIRRLLRGEVGPSGGPAFTDVLGVCASWGDGVCVVVREDGESVRIAIRDIVSGKPVPPRASVRLRVEPSVAHQRAAALFPGVQTHACGPWQLRWSQTESARRANSALALADPDPESVTDLVGEVEAFYRDRGRIPVAAVLPDSPGERALLAAGWEPQSNEADTSFQLVGVSRALRMARGVAVPEVTLDVATEPGGLTRASTADGAVGLAACDGEWVGVRAIEVPPHLRGGRRGLAILAALLEWGAESGATTAYLQVYSDNEPALRLYDGLGFVEHHRYRYLAGTS